MSHEDKYQKAPCGNCPFRKTALKGWLGEERMKEILKSDSFVCHKDHSKQCSGFMQIQGFDSAIIRVAKVMRLKLGLIGRKDIFDTKEDCINHHR